MRRLLSFALGGFGTLACGGGIASSDGGSNDGAIHDGSTDDANENLSEGGPTCGLGQTWCGSCTDITKDPYNCGVCGMKCGVAEYCAMGTCRSACSFPLQLCGMFCVDTSTDHDNCGVCGRQCAADEECSAKTCVKKTDI